MPAGRPTKLNIHLIEQVEALVPEIPHYQLLADYLGIHPETMRIWIRHGESQQRRIDRGLEPDPENALFHQFSVSVKRGLVSLYRTSLKKVRESEHGWQSAAWILERRWPELWGVSSPQLRSLERKLGKLIKEKAGEAC